MNCCCDCVSGLISILYFLTQTVTILVMMPDISMQISSKNTSIYQILVYVWLLLNDLFIITVWLSFQKDDIIMSFICTNMPECND